jgi:hypothetical protein
MGWTKEIPELRGKTILSVTIGQDDSGYDFLRITLVDGQVIEGAEDGYEGWMTLSHTRDGTTNTKRIGELE